MSERATYALKALLKVLPEKIATDDPRYSHFPKPTGLKLMIYVDEAHTITDDTGESVYDAFVKAFTDYKVHLLFAVFLSTAARAGELAAPAHAPSSSRKRAAGKSLIAPYTEMPFDCHPILKAKIDDTKSLSEVQSLSFLVYFGRSL